MPGSPVEVKIQSRSSPPNMPPLPPVNPGGPRPVSFTPTARKTPVTLLFPGSSSVQEERFCWQKSLGMSHSTASVVGKQGQGLSCSSATYAGHVAGSVILPYHLPAPV